MITTPTGPTFVKSNGQSGARSGDHTHPGLELGQRQLTDITVYETDRPTPGRNPIARASTETRAFQTMTADTLLAQSAIDRLTAAAHTLVIRNRPTANSPDPASLTQTNPTSILNSAPRWSHPPGNQVVPSPWQATGSLSATDLLGRVRQPHSDRCDVLRSLQIESVAKSYKLVTIRAAPRRSSEPVWT